MTISGYPIPLDAVEQWRGDPFILVLRIAVKAGAKVALNGYGTSWAAQARTRLTDPEHVDFTVDSTHVGDDPVSGDPRLILSLTGVQTAAMANTVYGFDVEASGGGESPFTVWRGSLTMNGDYTHA